MNCRQRKVHHLKFLPTRNRHLVPMVFPTVFTHVLAASGLSFFFVPANISWKERVLHCSVQPRVSIPKSATEDHQGRIVRSPDANGP